MHDEHPHPLLSQIPLTVSPLITLPTAPTLPYTYQTLPLTLPPPSTGDPLSATPAPFVISPTTGHRAHPDEIVAACRALQAHLMQMHEDAAQLVRDWDRGIKERELAEKRSLAPGWLDRDEKLLQPERLSRPTPITTITTPATAAAAGATGTELGDLLVAGVLAPVGPVGQEKETGQAVMAPRDEGAELDRAFGAMGIR
ncbi:MAG: hypothetical protein M1826_007323 [Phylliscum demangeonii]|nr:MAG: hypothetical protein M1826_007323 [Phylliscum demangeonii]